MSREIPAKLNILIVDDEPLVCDAVKMLLMFDGHSVETAQGGATALGLFTPGKFDLVLLDYEMPGMKGDQLAVELKRRAPNLPILMLTAYGEMLRSPGKPLKGVDLIVDKPFRLEQLREGIAKAMALYPQA
jgi:CheY-like chemotaxis protein